MEVLNSTIMAIPRFGVCDSIVNMVVLTDGGMGAERGDLAAYMGMGEIFGPSDDKKKRQKSELENRIAGGGRKLTFEEAKKYFMIKEEEYRR